MATRDKPIPITCAPEQVCGILYKQLSQMRFPMKDHPRWDTQPKPLRADPAIWSTKDILSEPEDIINSRACPYGVAGGILYLRESIRWVRGNEFAFAADGVRVEQEHAVLLKNRNYSPAMLPRAVCRIYLKTVEIRLQQLRQINIDDMEAEGTYRVEDSQDDSRDALLNIDNFRRLWDARYKKRGFEWRLNPWTWIIEFKRIEGI